MRSRTPLLAGVSLIEVIVMGSVLALILGMVAKAVVDSFRYQQRLEPKIQAIRETTIAANRISRDLETVTSQRISHLNYGYYDGAGEHLVDASAGSKLPSPTSSDPSYEDPELGLVPATKLSPLSMFCSRPAGLAAPFEYMAGQTSIAYFLDPYPDPNSPNYPNELGTIYRHTYMGNVPDPNDPLGTAPPLPEVYTERVLAKNIRSFEFTYRDTSVNPYSTTTPLTPVKEVEFRIAPGKHGGTMKYVTVLPPPPPTPLPAP